MRPVLAIASVNVRRMLRERSNLFFVFVFPLALVLLIGLAFGGDSGTRVAAHLPEDAGPIARDLIAGIERDGTVVDRYATAAGVRDSVSRGTAGGGVIVPSGYDAAAAAGQDVEVVTTVRPDRQDVRALLDAAVAEQSARLAAARAVADATDTPVDAALAAVDDAAGATPGVTVTVSSTGGGLEEAFAGLGAFDLGASSNLTLFVFVTSLAGGSALIQVRRLGLTRRMLASPKSDPRDPGGGGAGPLQGGDGAGALHRRRDRAAVRRGLGRPARRRADPGALLRGRDRRRHAHRGRPRQRRAGGRGRRHGGPGPGGAGWLDGAAGPVLAHAAAHRASHPARLGLRRLRRAGAPGRGRGGRAARAGVLAAYAAVLLAVASVALHRAIVRS